MKSTLKILGLVVGSALLLGACASEAKVEKVEILLTEFGISASQTTFEAGVPVHLVVTNAGAIEHELMIMPREVTDHHMTLLEVEEEDLPPGATVEVDFTFTETGEYEFACHVPGHYEAGMLLPITVTMD